MANTNRKQRFFERLSLNFRQVKESFPNLRVSPDIPGMVPCPLCLQTFAVTPGELTIEHAPPSKLGGKPAALTCKKCNNEQGSILESRLIEYYRIQESLTGNRALFTDATMQFDDLPAVRIQLNFFENNWNVVPVTKASNPNTIDAISRSFSQGIGPSRFKLQFRQPGLRTVRIALIRAAYLIAFGQLGYGFAVNPGLNYVRNLFRTPDDESLYPHGVIFGFKCPDDFLGVNIVTHPPEMRAYLVAFDLFDSDKPIDRIGVVLPGWTDNPLQLYEYLDSINGQIISVTMHKLSAEIDLFLDAPLAALEFWNDLLHRA